MDAADANLEAAARAHDEATTAVAEAEMAYVDAREARDGDAVSEAAGMSVCSTI